MVLPQRFRRLQHSRTAGVPEAVLLYPYPSHAPRSPHFRVSSTFSLHLFKRPPTSCDRPLARSSGTHLQCGRLRHWHPVCRWNPTVAHRPLRAMISTGNTSWTLSTHRNPLVAGALPTRTVRANAPTRARRLRPSTIFIRLLPPSEKNGIASSLMRAHSRTRRDPSRLIRPRTVGTAPHDRDPTPSSLSPLRRRRADAAVAWCRIRTRSPLQSGARREGRARSGQLSWSRRLGCSCR